MSERIFNPIESAHIIERSYRDYLSSTIHFDNENYQRQLERLLATPGVLSKGPFLEATPPYHPSKTPRQLIECGALHEDIAKLADFDLDRPFYEHQVKAIEKANEGHNFVVVTGTGSGKTECFLIPILNDILAEFAKGGCQPGIRAMLLYPMNALANDQLKRLRSLLEGTDITFGRYTGDTKEDHASGMKQWHEENPDAKKLPNEIVSREEIRQQPPNILLTNYSMLEYLLLRPKDEGLFKGVFGTSWRHIVIDEAHVYSGTLGTEIAFLIRRLKARIASDTGVKPKLHCYATSATIGSDEDIPKVAEFARNLFGEPFSSDLNDLDIITSLQDSPVDYLSSTPWGALPLETWIKLRDELSSYGSESPSEETASCIESILKGLIPDELLKQRSEENPLVFLGTALLGERTTMAVVKRVSESLLDMTDSRELDELGIDGLSVDTNGINTFAAIIEVLARAQRATGIPVLATRYHSFLRAPEGLYTDFITNELSADRQTMRLLEDGEQIPSYELSICRHCGQTYILGKRENDSEADTYCAWLNPAHPQIDSDEDFAPRTYYRLDDGTQTDEVEYDDSETSEEICGNERVLWLCPRCGSLHSNPNGGPHRFKHPASSRIKIIEGKASEDNARCDYCGYTNRFAIQPMRVSPEAIGSVVCYNLVREIPAFEIPDESLKPKPRFSTYSKPHSPERPGSVICFSDRRQDAAYFAPALSRTYNKITQRQLMFSTLREIGTSCEPIDLASRLAHRLKTCSFDNVDLSSQMQRQDVAQAWVLDELMAEDRRNSLEGLGLILVEPSEFLEFINDGGAQEYIQETFLDSLAQNSFANWIDIKTYIILIRYSIETLRESGAIERPLGSDEYMEIRSKAKYVTVGDSSTRGKQSPYVNFTSLDKGTQNKRSNFIKRFVLRNHNLNLGASEINQILRSIFDCLSVMLGYFQENGNEVVEVQGGNFILKQGLWHLSTNDKSSRIYRCDKCGSTVQYDTGGVCTVNNCDGTMRQTTLDEVYGVDSFYKEVYQSQALPIRVEEHTAQLDSSEAREIQTGFLKGKVNVLSCTTTFELGVDVGDLRAVFLRNVPPSPANYTQRAGRTGRRAELPGFAITFARLRPHDIRYYRHPDDIIKGTARAPFCYLENKTIAIRHIFAIALSQFFRDAPTGDSYADSFTTFLNIQEDHPAGVEEFRSYLDKKPIAISRQIDSICSDTDNLRSEIGADDWAWVESLIGEGNDARLLFSHMLLREDYSQLERAIEILRDEGKPTSGLIRRQESLMGRKTISVLAESGVIPKYGFPTDVVELKLDEQERSSTKNKLCLSRGRRQAIREYAPGAEIIANKTLWKSNGIRKQYNQSFSVRYYGQCSECGGFVWPIEDGTNAMDCPTCGNRIELNKRMIIPLMGFTGSRVKDKRIGEKRPRSTGAVRIYFSREWPEGQKTVSYSFPGGKVETRLAGNERLCAINEGHRTRGFVVCPTCGGAAPTGGTIKHAVWCKTKNFECYNALGAPFVTDALELEFDYAQHSYLDYKEEDWISAKWALANTAAIMLEVPESEIGITSYVNSKAGTMAFLLYDDVPGGAGHALQLSEYVDRLLNEAYQRVHECTCGEESCCYGCLCNYFNQYEQSLMTRKGALTIIGDMLGKGAPLS